MLAYVNIIYHNLHVSVMYFCTDNADDIQPSMLECVKPSPVRIINGLSLNITHPGHPS